MTDLRQAAQQALEALKYNGAGNMRYGMEAITALKSALEQPEQKPVAWMVKLGDVTCFQHHADSKHASVPLYTVPPAAQRQWQGLTDEDKKKIATAAGCTEDDDGHIVTEIFRLAEAKLKVKNDH